MNVGLKYRRRKSYRPIRCALLEFKDVNYLSVARESSVLLVIRLFGSQGRLLARKLGVVRRNWDSTENQFL